MRPHRGCGRVDRVGSADLGIVGIIGTVQLNEPLPIAPADSYLDTSGA